MMILLLPFFWMTVFFAAISLVLLLIPSFRPVGKKFFWGTISAVLALILYQLAYIPVYLAGFVLSTYISRFIELIISNNSVINTFDKGVRYFFVFILWSIVVLGGYTSGFRVGWQYGGGTSLIDSIRSDYLTRICLWIVNIFRRLVRVRHST